MWRYVFTTRADFKKKSVAWPNTTDREYRWFGATSTSVFHDFKNIRYIECMPGYSGLDCTTRCPYPTYGNRCQGYCNCSNYTCDVSTGCRTLTTGQSFFPYRCLQFTTCTFTYTYVFQYRIYCLYLNVKFKN